VLSSCFFPHNLIQGKILNLKRRILTILSYYFCTRISRQVSMDFSVLSSPDEGEKHHRVSFSIGDDSAVDGTGRKKKGTRGTPKRDLSSSLTNDRTSNGASRLALREQRSWYVESETKGRKALFLSLSHARARIHTHTHTHTLSPLSRQSVSIPLKRRWQLSGTKK